MVFKGVLMSDSSKSGAKVAHIENRNRIVINKGADYGVEEGDRYLIYSLGPEIFDPDTNESLGRLEIIKGKGVVINVQQKLSVIETEKPAVKVKTRKIPGITSGIASAFADRVEIIEEKFPTEEFYDVKEGDCARLIGSELFYSHS